MPKAGYPYQHVGFHFAVAFHNQNFNSLDARFQSVSGLNVTLQYETIKEGGENRYDHRFPTRRTYSDLVLKRGVFSPDDGSAITDWCIRAFEGFRTDGSGQPIQLQVEPVNITIALLDENHLPLMRWEVIHAWPKSWKFGDLNAERSEVLIETLELHYNRFEFKGIFN